MTTSTIVSRKVLVPLATVLPAGSGATFTSTTDNTTSAVTAGHLSHSNSKQDAAVFTITKLKPGDVVNGSLTLTNTGNLPASFTLREPSSTNTFASTGTANYLHLKITDDTAASTVYDGDFGGLADDALKSLGTLAPNAAHTFTFAVSMDANTPNSEQDKTASATYQWVSTQLAGTTTAQ